MEPKTITQEHKTNRILELDTVKGIGAFFIPMAHTLLIYGTPETQGEGWLGLLVHFFGKWAGIFLIAMGFTYALSKKHNILGSVKRGFILLGAGYFMNFLKFIVPLFLGLLPNNFIEAYGWTAPITFENMVYMVLTGDILQLAGMCLLFMGVVQKLALNYTKWVPVLLTVFILASLEFVRGTQVGILPIDYILDLLWGGDWNVYFAVFPWFGYILVGMFFGYWYKEQQNNIAFITKKMTIAGFVIVLVGGALCYYNYDFHMRDYFHMGIGGFLYLLGFNLLCFSLARFIVKKYHGNKTTNFFYYCSKKITSIYIIQWVIICLGMGIFGFHSQETWSVLPIMVLITVLTFVLQKALDFLLEKNSKKILVTN